MGKNLTRSVTRLGEILPLCKKLKVFAYFYEGFFSVLEKIEPILLIFMQL